MEAPKIAAVLILSLAMGAMLTHLARRFAGETGVSGPWVVAGAIGVALCSLAACSRAKGPPYSLWIDLGLGWTLLMLAAIDVAALRLPDAITIPLAVAGLALGGASAPLSARFAGLALGVGTIAALDILYHRLRGRAGIGLGDAKLLGAAGAWLGWRALPSVLLLACAGGLVWIALRVLARGRAAAGAPLPFGAPLCAAIWILGLLSG